jgi:hypothetical protein
MAGFPEKLFQRHVVRLNLPLFFDNACLGPFVGDTSHPILLIGNTAGV